MPSNEDWYFKKEVLLFLQFSYYQDWGIRASQCTSITTDSIIRKFFH